MKEGHLFRFGPFRLDPVERVLFRGSEPVTLSPRAFDVLAMLVEHAGHVVEKDTLLNTVWAGTFVEDGNLSQQVFHLRRVLGSDPLQYIETVPRRGYRFAAPVAVEIRRTAGGRWGWTVPALVAAAIVLAVVLRLWNPPGDPKSARTVAVLPFLNLSPGAENEYLSDGMTEELIAALARIPEMQVVARTSVFRFKGKAGDIRDIGRQLRASAILEGSVRQRDGQLHVTAQLIRVADGVHLWAETYDRPATAVFSIQEDICGEIAARLKVPLPSRTGRRLVRQYSENLEAYTLYWKARYQWNRRSLEGVRKAMDYFQNVIEREPRYALAFAGLADCYNLLGGYDVERPDEAFPRARDAARKAIELDPTLAEAHASLGSIKGMYEWDWTGAEKEYRRAIEMDPGYATAHQWYAEHLAAMGRGHEAEREMRTALELEPLSPTVNYVSAFLWYLARDFDRSVQESLKTRELDPSFPVAPFVLGYAYEAKGLYAEAAAEFEKGMKLTGGFGARYLAHCLALAGRRDEALRILAALLQRSRTSYVPAYDFALIYMGLGDRNRAFEWLGKAYIERSNRLTHLNVDPRFDPLRQDPRFAELVGKVGLPR